MNTVINEIFEAYKNFDEVRAIAAGGSAAAKTSDLYSDIDVYVFVTHDIPVEKRTKLVRKYSSKYETGGEYFGSGDEFLVDKTGIQLDVMYWNIDWFKTAIENVWDKYYPSNGYTTCFLYTLSNFETIYEKNNFLSGLKSKISGKYPAELKNNIIKRNLMLMKDKPFASYYEQIEKAVKRNDIVSVNHRTAAFLASYFDVIFAVNELLHPGEKRLVTYAENNCKILPADFETNIEKLLSCNFSEVTNILNIMTENLRKIL